MPRGTTAERMAVLERKRNQIEQRLKSLTAQEAARKRRDDTRRKIIVGAAVLAHAERDGEFAKALQDVLGKAVTRDIDRKAVADLLRSSTS